MKMFKEGNTDYGQWDDGLMSNKYKEEPVLENNTMSSGLDSSDKSHLEWIHDRLEHVYGTPRDMDFMIRLRKIINKI